MSVRSQFFPYCLRRLDDGRYIILNRYYKPVGLPNLDFIDYVGHPSVVALDLTPAIILRLAVDSEGNGSSLFLYHDECVPTDSAQHMRAYLARLEVLMHLKIDRSRQPPWPR